MNMDMVNGVLEVVFNSAFVYLMPAIFLLLIALFSDSIVDLIFRSVTLSRRRR